MNLQDLRYILLDLDLSGFRHLLELRHATLRRSLLITDYWLPLTDCSRAMRFSGVQPEGRE